MRKVWVVCTMPVENVIYFLKKCAFFRLLVVLFLLQGISIRVIAQDTTNSESNDSGQYDAQSSSQGIYSQYIDSLQWFDKHIKQARDKSDYVRIMELLKRKSDMYLKAQMFEKALPVLFEGIQLAQKSGNKREEARFKLNVAKIMHLSKNYGNARYYMQQCLKIYESLNDSEGLAETYIMLGGSEFIRKNWKEAKNNYAKGGKYYKLIGDVYGEAKALNNIGSTYLEINQLDSSLIVLRQAEQLILQFGDSTRLYAIIIMNLGELNMKKGNSDSALHFFGKVSDIIGNSEIDVKLNLEELYSTLYKKNNNPRLAMKHLENVIAIKEQINLSQNTLNINKIINEYELWIKDSENEILRKNIEIKQYKIDSDLFTFYSLLAAVFGAGLIIAILLGALRVRRKYERKLLLKSNETQQLNLELAELNKMLESKVDARTVQLSLSEQKFRNFASVLPEVIFELKADSTILFCNTKAIDIFGFSTEEMLNGKGLKDLFTQEYQSKCDELIENAKTDIHTGGVELVALRKDGIALPVMAYLSPIISDNSLSGYAAVITDISKLKHAEKAILKSKNDLLALLQQLPVAVLVFDLNGKLTFANSQFQKLCGNIHIIVTELYSLTEYIPEASQFIDLLMKNVGQKTAVSVESDMDHRFLCNSVTEKYVRVKATYLPENLLITIIDVTLQRNVESALFEREQKFKSLIQNASDIIAVVNSDGTISFVSPSIQNLGYDTKELLGKNVKDFMQIDDFEQVINALKNTSESTRNNPLVFESRILHKNGNWVYMESKVMEQFRNKYISGIIVNARDITGRKAVENQLRKFYSAVEKSDDAIFIAGQNGLIEFVNERFKEINRISDKEALRINLFVKSEQTYFLTFPAIQALKNGKYWKGTLRRQFSENEYYYESVSISRLRNDVNEIISYIGISQDITREKINEEKVRQSQKMQAIGTLAGGIAHDFNNILFAMLNYTKIAQLELQKDTPVYNYLQEVILAGKRARDIIAQILEFSKQNSDRLVPLKLAQLVTDTVSMIRATVPPDIKIEMSLKVESLVLANQAHIHQILINLTTNALQAMHHGGVLSISLDHYNKKQLPADAATDDWVCLKISDTGTGIDDQIMSRIFDPFFTTKEAGKGTGLGLSIVHSLVKRMGGEIYAKSKKGIGTEFSIILPLHKTENN